MPACTSAVRYRIFAMPYQDIVPRYIQVLILELTGANFSEREEEVGLASQVPIRLDEFTEQSSWKVLRKTSQPMKEVCCCLNLWILEGAFEVSSALQFQLAV